MNSEYKMVATLLAGGEPGDYQRYATYFSSIEDPTLKRIVERIESIANQGRAFDVATIWEEFNGDPVINAAYLSRLSAASTLPQHIPDIARELADERFRLRLLEAAKAGRSQSAGALAQAVQQVVWEYQQGGGAEVDREESWRRMLDNLEEEMRQGPQLETGIRAIDDLAGGFRPGEVTYLGARPSVGKTALAVQVANHLLLHGHRVLYIDYESGDEAMMRRFVALRARIPIVNVSRPYTLTTEQAALVAAETAKMAKLPLYINDRMSIGVGDIHALALGAQAEIVVVDYLNLMVHHSENEVAELGDTMLGFQRIAKDLKVPILVLGQLNRKLEDRGNKAPVMSDIRGSGRVEEMATQIWFLHYPNRWDTGKPVDEMELHIVKSKHGPVGIAYLSWSPRRNLFGDRIRVNGKEERGQ